MPVDIKMSITSSQIKTRLNAKKNDPANKTIQTSTPPAKKDANRQSGLQSPVINRLQSPTRPEPPKDPNSGFICDSCKNNETLRASLQNVHVVNFATKLSELKTLNDDLSERISQIEMLDLHLKHLLLDKTALKALDVNNTKVDKMNSNLESLISSVAKMESELNEFRARKDPDNSESIDKLCTKIDDVANMVSLVGQAEVAVDKEDSVTFNSRSTLSSKVDLSKLPGPISDNIEDFMDATSAQELLSFCRTLKYEEESGHGVMSFGEDYKYSSRKRSKPDAIPKPLMNLIDAVKAKFPDNSIPTAALINRYSGPHSFLPEHSDDETSLDPTSSVYTFSLGSSSTVKFRGLHSDIVHDHLATSNSLYVMSKHSQSFWSHRIGKPADDENYERFSITLRVVDPKFMKSSIIIGDSNTKYLKFGKGLGTFGYYMPGHQIYTPKLEEN